MISNNLDNFFNPCSIAVVGASDQPGSVGWALMRNLLEGFKGKVYPVNIRRKEVHGLPAWKRVSDLPHTVDLAIIATPAETVAEILEECGRKGVRGVVVISAGFKEVGVEGKRRYSELKIIIGKYPMRVLGPNCMGFIRPGLNLNASFARKEVLAGKIAFISQSGALGTAILDWSFKHKVGFSHFISVGEAVDLDFDDLINYFADDKKTEALLLYIESLSDVQKFMTASRAFTKKKPIVALKVGTSSEGARAALSHTGSLAGDDLVFEAALKRAGILRVKSLKELFDCSQGLAMQNLPLGKRLTIVTNAGGAAVVAVDALIENGGKLAKLSLGTLQKLGKILPKGANLENPVDLWGDAGAERYKKAIEVTLNDVASDAVLMILTPQAMTNPQEIAKAVLSLPKKEKKMLLACYMGEEAVAEGTRRLRLGKVPVYHFPEEAVKTFLYMYSHKRNLSFLCQKSSLLPGSFKPKKRANLDLIKKAIQEKRTVLTEFESKQFLENYGIPIPKSALARSEEEAITVAKKIGLPVAMKISSHLIIHKTDYGGVRLNLDSLSQVGKTYKEIIGSCNRAFPAGCHQEVLVEEMINKKYELILGSKKDPLFGPTILFGMGGVAVEVFKDINVGLPPLDMALAKDLIQGTKIYNLLKGYRGIKGVNLEAMQFLLYKFSCLLVDFGQIKEIDVNPFVVDQDGAMVLDAQVIFDPLVLGKKARPYSHLAILPYLGLK